MSSLNGMIVHQEPIACGATAVYPYSPALERRFRFVSRFDEEVSLCRRDGDVLHLPRAVCPVGANDNRVVGAAVDFPSFPTPRPHQKGVFEQTVAFLKKGQSGIVEAYTGWGKTVLGCYAAAKVGRKTIVVTTKEDLFNMWIEEARKFLGLSDHEIGVIRQDKCDVKGKKFIVAMIHSLSIPGRYPDGILDDVGLAIFDECHRVPADQFQGVVYLIPALLRLGLTATPERADGKEAVILAHIGPIRARTEAQLMVPTVLRFRSGWQCPRVRRRDPTTGQSRIVPMPHSPGKVTHVIKHLAEDENRNKLLAELGFTAYRKGRKTVYFSDLLDHLQLIHRGLVAMGVPGKEIGFYVGGTTKTEKEAREKAKVRPILLATYTMMGEGTNIPWLDLGIQATPRSSVEQPCGRVRREYEGKKDPVWMDIVDDDSPVFAGYARKRLRWYRQIGATVKDM